MPFWFHAWVLHNLPLKLIVASETSNPIRLLAALLFSQMEDSFQRIKPIKESWNSDQILNWNCIISVFQVFHVFHLRHSQTMTTLDFGFAFIFLTEALQHVRFSLSILQFYQFSQVFFCSFPCALVFDLMVYAFDWCFLFHNMECYLTENFRFCIFWVHW